MRSGGFCELQNLKLDTQEHSDIHNWILQLVTYSLTWHVPATAMIEQQTIPISLG